MVQAALRAGAQNMHQLSLENPDRHAPGGHQPFLCTLGQPHQARGQGRDATFDGTTGPTRLMLGSDYPFAIMDPDPVGRLATLLALDEPTRALLRHGNAARWLGLEGAA